MKRVRLISVICFFLLLTFALSASNVNELFPNAVNGFGLRLMKQLSEESPDENIVISPVSISLALTMAMNGAEGETLQEMKEVLGYGDVDNEDINESVNKFIELYNYAIKRKYLNISSCIHYSNKFNIRTNFKNIVENNYMGEMAPIDFNSDTAAEEINDWFSEKTNGRVPSMVRDISSEIVLLILNSVHFRSKWSNQFPEEKTKIDNFYLIDKSKYNCEMMYNELVTSYIKNEFFQKVTILYEDLFYLDIYLPNRGIEISNMWDIFPERRKDFYSQSNNTNVNLYLPKFELDGEFDMSKTLTSLGMVTAFGKNANFHKLFSDINPPIQQIVHKTFIKLDEKGTEAVGTTIVCHALSSMTEEIPPVVDMIVNRPFVFVISDIHTNSMLFLGKVMKPEWKE